MSHTIIKVENLSKAYQIGQIGTGTISQDLERFFVTRILRKEDPFLKIGESNDRSLKGTSNIVWSLKDINFNIEQGDAVGIIGKNGAGKSTLLKILSRVTSPTNGSIKVKGRISSLLEVGTGFHPELSGRENIYLNGAILGMRKKEISKKLDEIIDFSGVERYIDTPVKRYSSGMYVRLAFAVAAHLESEILIVDEVLAVGDADFQKKCLGKMGDISKGEGRTILFVSHNMAAIKNLCQTGILLDKGTINYNGNIDTCVNQYLTQSYNAHKIDIENSSKRTGTQTVQFTDFHIENEKDQIISKVLTGDTITFVFTLKANKDWCKNVDVGFSIHNSYGDFISVLYSSYQNQVFDLEKKGYYTLRCTINDFNYTLNQIQIFGLIKENGLEADWLKIPLGIYEIEIGDYYKTGNKGYIKDSICNLKGNWNINAVK